MRGSSDLLAFTQNRNQPFLSGLLECKYKHSPAPRRSTTNLIVPFELTMQVPTIRVEHSEGTASVLTLYYALGSNSIDTVAVAATVYNLSSHPGHARTFPDKPGTAEVIPCSETFLTSFWSAAASLLDYFADFYATDIPVMQSVWFHLLDTWQAAGPIALYKHDHDFWYSREAQTFKNNYGETLALFQRLVGQPQGQKHWHGPTEDKYTEALIHAPGGRVEARAGAYETGPFISGLKPWQQFLLAGAPGFSLSSATATTSSDNEDGGDTSTITQDPTTRYIPQPAIAILQTHTLRARNLSARLATKQTPVNLPAITAAFDATALVFPSLTTREYTAASPLAPGTAHMYSLVQGAPPATRHEGLLDPSMLAEIPDLMLLDEAVGNCKGSEAYVPMTGPRGVEGVGFDVWAVVVGRSGGDGGECGKSAGEMRWGEVFDEWEFGREE